MAVNDETREFHVLMVTLPAQGHINPMLHLGRRLLSRGLRVTVATTELARHRILRSSTASADSVSGINLAFFSDGLSLDYDRNNNLDAYMDSLARSGTSNLSALARDLYADDPRKKLSCVVASPFVPWAAGVAAAHGVPCALFWIQPCILYAIYYRFYNDLDGFPGKVAAADTGVELAAGLPPLSSRDLPSFILPSNTFGSFPKLLSGTLRNMGKYRWVLANSFDKMEATVVQSMADVCPVTPVGPLIPPAFLGDGRREGDDAGIDLWRSEEKCVEWLSQHPPNSVIFVSFGSIVVLSANQMASMAHGLRNSNRPFLWVVKPADYPVQEGAGVVPAGFEEDVRGRGMVVPWCPQTAVLTHSAVACFLTHCGWNSTLEAIAAGVPMIAFPQWTDQPTNAKLIVDVLGLGVRLRAREDGVVGSEDVEKCVEEMTSGPRAVEYRRRAAELKAAARDAAADGGSSDRNLQQFVDEIKATSGGRL